MASQGAPPGFNPEISLLQGGTTPILPVQGGGGAAPPPDYNPSVSLLQGGVGVIEAVKGGASVSFAANLEKEREFSKEAPAKNVSRASRAYTLEIYGLETSGPTLKLDQDLSSRQRRLLQYTNKEKKTELITSVTSLPAGGFAFTEYPKYGDCKPSLPINYFTVLPKKVYFFDDKPHTLWVIPNIQGDKQTFEYIVNLLAPDGKLPEPTHILIFTGSFYPTAPNDTSVLFFDQILKLKEKNPNQVFVLSTPNSNLLNTGCYILDHTYAMKTTLAKQQGKTKDIPTFLEPEILVFPHEQIIIRSAELPVSNDAKVSVGLLLKKKIKSKAYLIKPQTGRKTEPAPFEQFVTVLSNPNQAETKGWPAKAQQSIKCPKDTDCNHFEIGFGLEKLGDASTLNLLQQKLFLFHITLEKIPYFTGFLRNQKENEKPEENQPVEEEEAEEEIGEEPEPTPTAVIQRPKRVAGPYKEDPSATVSPQTVSITVEGILYKVRVPFSSSTTDQIKNDWMKERFTKDEADLLNALQLQPGILKKAFGLGYKWRVSNFLSSLAISSCFKESKLLLKSECDDARQFLRKVTFELQRGCLNQLSKQWGSPVEGTVVEAEEPPKETPPPVEAEETPPPEEEEEEVVLVENEPEETPAPVVQVSQPLRQITKNLNEMSIEDEYNDLDLEKINQLLKELELEEEEENTGK